jgi:hypothetical protein
MNVFFVTNLTPYLILHLEQVLKGADPKTWPSWVEDTTVISHLLLALNASVNLVSISKFTVLKS